MLAPIPYSRGHRRAPDHVRAVDAGHGRRARPAGARPLPAPGHPERRVPAQGRGAGRRGPGPARRAVGPRPREPRSGDGHQGLRRRAARGRPAARAGPRPADVEGAPGPPAGHLRPVPRRRPVLRQRRADPGRRRPGGSRGGHPRRHHQLRVPLHAAGLAAADHRLRAGRPAPLARRLGPSPGCAGRRHPPHGAGVGRRPPAPRPSARRRFGGTSGRHRGAWCPLRLRAGPGRAARARPRDPGRQHRRHRRADGGREVHPARPSWPVSWCPTGARCGR